MKVVFIGTSEFGVPALNALVASPDHTVVGVVTQPDRPVGRQQKLTASPIKQAAFRHHIKIFQPEQIKRDSVVKQIAYLKPDVIVVAAYGQILPKLILDLPQYGCLNLHASILPKFRGASPIQSALLAREKKSGVTVMWMDEGLDTGDVLLVGETSIKSDDTAQTLHDRLALIGAKSLLAALEQIKKGKATRTAQSDLGVPASYAKKLTKEHGRIDWAKGKREIDAHIRAMTPWPSAYTWVPDNASGAHDQKMLKIFTTIFSSRAKGKPGEVVHIDKHGVLVSTGGTGGLLLREVQLEGKKRMHAAEFARGFNLAVGTILG